MAEEDEDKVVFHMERGMFYYTKIPFGLRNVGATYQRIVEKTYKVKIRRNMEAYVDDSMIKRKSDQFFIKDIR